MAGAAGEEPSSTPAPPPTRGLTPCSVSPQPLCFPPRLPAQSPRERRGRPDQPGPPDQPDRKGPTGSQGPAGLDWRGSWDAGTTYASGDAVFFNGSSYVATASSSAAEPDISASMWSVLASQGATGPSGATRLSGEVTGSGSSTVVTAVVSGNTAGSIVRRDAQGNFSAGTITASLAGNATTASAFTGSLAGDVGGTQSATVIQANAVTASKIASGQVVKSLNGLHDALTISGGGNNSVSAVGSTLTITASGPSSVSAGNGLSGGGSSGAVTLAVWYGGDGVSTQVARADHDHVGQTWLCTSTACKDLILETSATDPNTAGVYGYATSTTSQGVGVWGTTNSGNLSSTGIYGLAPNSSGGNAKGVWGEAGGIGIAVYGLADGTSGAKAAEFDGNVAVVGSLSRSSGSFKIDHPLDPEHQYLYHSFVESPDMKNIYDGVVTLDARGEAPITMPDWFEALNMEFRYQLTAIGASQPGLYVAATMRGNQFRIVGGLPGAEVSWQVTGTRHDAWANANRIPAEEKKPDNEQGTFLYPEGFGASRESGLSAKVRGGFRQAPSAR